MTNTEPTQNRIWPSNLGVELTTPVLQNLPELAARHRLNHIQVSIPGQISPEKLNGLKDFSLVIHSNLLNTLGKNDWSELAPVAKRISSLNPVRTIEHFTQFVDINYSKRGIDFDPNFKRTCAFHESIDSMRRWQEMLGHQLAVENAPITENVDEYFEYLIRSKQQGEIEVVCDVPHLLISAVAAKWSNVRIQEIASELNPPQIHIGGLSTLNGKLRDNHRMISPWAIEMAKSVFHFTPYVTLEQSPALPSPTVSKLLSGIREPTTNVNNAHWEADVLSVEETNSVLAASAFNWPDNVVINASHPSIQISASREAVDPFRLLEKYTPFFYPLGTIESASELLEYREGLKLATALTKSALTLGKWWALETDDLVAEVRCGTGAKLEFSAMIDELIIRNDHDFPNVFSKSYRFQMKNEHWVEVATPSVY